MYFSVSKCEQNDEKLWICSHFLKKSSELDMQSFQNRTEYTLLAVSKFTSPWRKPFHSSSIHFYNILDTKNNINLKQNEPVDNQH